MGLVNRTRGAVAIIGLSVTVLMPTAAEAECMLQVNRFPPYTEVASTARRVVIGTVTEALLGHDPTGPLPVFRIQVDEVLRGRAPAQMDVLGLRSGLPVHGSPACRRDASLYARMGDVLAIAVDGRYDGHGGVNTVAFIHGRPGDLVKGTQRLTLEEARRAAATLPATSTSATDARLQGRRHDQAPALGWAGLATAAAAGGWLFRRRRLGAAGLDRRR
jgi:LPXTG-motif cell wall-anchored protein